MSVETSRQLMIDGIETVSSHNKDWMDRAVQELSWMRSASVNENSPRHNQRFIFEDVLPDLEQLIGRKIPHFNLAGAICACALKKGVIRYTSNVRWSVGDSKHRRKCFEYEWNNKGETSC